MVLEKVPGMTTPETMTIRTTHAQNRRSNHLNHEIAQSFVVQTRIIDFRTKVNARSHPCTRCVPPCLGSRLHLPPLFWEQLFKTTDFVDFFDQSNKHNLMTVRITLTPVGWSLVFRLQYLEIYDVLCSSRRAALSCTPYPMNSNFSFPLITTCWQKS